MRRRAGVAAIQRKKVDQAKFKEKGEELAETSMSKMAKQMETFRMNLEEFSRNHKQEIKRDPEFRKHFQVSHDAISSKMKHLKNRFDVTGYVCFDRSRPPRFR